VTEQDILDLERDAFSGSSARRRRRKRIEHMLKTGKRCGIDIQFSMTREIPMSEIREAVIVSAVRSAVGKGKKDGALASVHPTELSAWVMRAAVQQAGVDPTTIDDIYWGCAMPEAVAGAQRRAAGVVARGIPRRSAVGDDQPVLLVLVCRRSRSRRRKIMTDMADSWSRAASR